MNDVRLQNASILGLLRPMSEKSENPYLALSGFSTLPGLIRHRQERPDEALSGISGHIWTLRSD
jgi:hypothetical protein